jgi:hypothetical protein
MRIAQFEYGLLSPAVQQSVGRAGTPTPCWCGRARREPRRRPPYAHRGRRAVAPNAAQIARVDDAHRIATVSQMAVEITMPFSCRLDSDQLDVMMRQPADDLVGACLGVGNPEGFLGGKDVDIEPQLADIDSHGRFGLSLLFGPILALHAGLAPHHLFRTRAEERTDYLTDGAPSQGGIRSRPLAPGTAAAVPGAQSLCGESPNDPPSESAKSTYKGA